MLTSTPPSCVDDFLKTLEIQRDVVIAVNSKAFLDGANRQVVVTEFMRSVDFMQATMVGNGYGSVPGDGQALDRTGGKIYMREQNTVAAARSCQDGLLRPVIIIMITAHNQDVDRGTLGR